MMHRLLARQLKHLGLNADNPAATPEQWQSLLQRISAYYEDTDQGRYLLERSLAISSAEMQALYEGLKASSSLEIDAQRKRLHIVANALDDALCAYSFEEGLLFVNDAGRRLFGAPGVPADASLLIERLQAPGTRRDARALEIEGLLKLLRLTQSPHRLRATLFTGAASRVPVHCTFTPLREEGRLIGFVLLFHDLTEQLETETRLRLAASVMQANEAIIIADRLGRIIEVNPALTRSMGYLPEEVIGHSARMLRAHGQKNIYTAMREALNLHGHWDGEVQSRHKDGSIRPQWLSVTTVRDEDGGISHFVSHFTDIAALKALEQSLRKAVEDATAADQAKTEFLAVVSHEMRTPINIMLGVADLFTNTELDAYQRELLAMLEKSGQHLSQVVDDILGLISRRPVDAKLGQEVFSPHALLDGILEMMRHRAELKKLTLEVRIEAAVPQAISGTPRYLRQILINLIGNAIKFTDRGRITVEMRFAGKGKLACTVTDSGIGISAGSSRRLFQPFIQLDNRLTHTQGGLGLGLAVSKKLAEEMGGRIWLISRADTGSQFGISLPYSAAPAPAEKFRDPTAVEHEIDGSAALPRLVHSYRILLVDDSEDTSMLFRAFLEDAGLEVDTAANGREAVERFEREPPDLVIMDIQMPVMDGYEATRRIRDWEMRQNLRPTPIIALTAHATAEHARLSAEAGCDLHLTKPLSRECLVREVLDSLRQMSGYSIRGSARG